MVHSRAFALSLTTAILAMSPPLRAQFGPPGAGPMGAGPGRRESRPAKKRVVEAARPQGPKLPRPIRPKEWAPKRPMQLFDLDGYLRFRADFFYKPHLGWPQTAGSPPPPFPNNPGGYLDNQNQFWTANMRLRLEPTFNVHETVKVYVTVDVFDNMVLGSTPEGFNILHGEEWQNVGRIPYASLNAFSATQEPLDKGYNSRFDAIRVKHAWAEVLTPLGMIKFGRMPSHWGLGILANSGMCREAAKWTVEQSASPGWCLDSDYEDIADRVMFATRIPNIDLIVALAYDFAAQGLDSSLTSLFNNQRQGQPYDLIEADDVHQVILAVARVDKPERVRELLDQDRLVVNYGFYGVFRKQSKDYHYQTQVDPRQTVGDFLSNIVERDAWALIPDFWFRLNWRHLQIEFEGVLIGGEINNLEDTGSLKSLKILQWGFVLRGQYGFLNDSLRVRLEIGHASGDDNLEARDHQLNYRQTAIIPDNPSDKYNTLFKFDPSYYVDLIFFREIMGTVYNATYFKPSLFYDVSESLGLRADAIFSLANEPVATPGNSQWYGIELDADIEYRNLPHGFVAGLAYGVFFPLGALDLPASLYGTSTDASIAHTLQVRLVTKF